MMAFQGTFQALATLVILVGWPFQPAQVAPTAGGEARLISPSSGQVLQGAVAVRGGTGVENFQSAEISFTYSGDTTGAWFLIAELNEPVAEGFLAQWDTSTITDGDYTLRLLVSYKDGSQSSASVSGLRVRNYTAIETPTPAPAGATAIPPGGNVSGSNISGSTGGPGTGEPAPTPSGPGQRAESPAAESPAAENPAQVTDQELITSLGKGALAALGAFSLIGIYGLLKSSRRKRDRNLLP